MRSMTARDAKNRFGELLMEAQRAPVTIEKNGKEFEVNLKFRSMDDFEPEKIVEQIEPLRKLMETRNQLRDLMAKADGSEQLEGLLEKILKDDSSLASLRSQLGEAGTKE